VVGVGVKDSTANTARSAAYSSASRASSLSQSSESAAMIALSDPGGELGQLGGCHLYVGLSGGAERGLCGQSRAGGSECGANALGLALGPVHVERSCSGRYVIGGVRQRRQVVG